MTLSYMLGFVSVWLLAGCAVAWILGALTRHWPPDEPPRPHLYDWAEDED